MIYINIQACNNDNSFNTLRWRQNGRHFADDTFKRIFLNENVIISTEISLKFVPKGPINNIPALVQIMAWRRSGDKPLSEPVMVSLLTHICVTRPQWVNWVTVCCTGMILGLRPANERHLYKVTPSLIGAAKIVFRWEKKIPAINNHSQHWLKSKWIKIQLKIYHILSQELVIIGSGNVWHQAPMLIDWQSDPQAQV